MTKNIDRKFTLKSTLMPVVLGSLVAVGTALVAILLFALVIRFANVSQKLITPTNIFIKILSIALGVFFATKNGEKGLLKGILVGIVFVFFAFIIFSILSSSFTVGASLLIDFGLGIVVGALTGIVFVNLRRN